MADDEAYRAVLAELAKLHEAWRMHREVINRAVGLLNQEVVGLIDRMRRDDSDRVQRQAQVDSQFAGIQRSLVTITKWQRLRVALEVVAIVVVLAFLIGRGV